MNKDVLVPQICHSAKITKDFTVRQYHRLVNYLAEKKIELNNKGYSMESTKDFIVRQYHRLAEYLKEMKLERKTKGSNVILGMRCTKYMLVLLNVFYLMNSLFMIVIGTSVRLADYIFRDYFFWFEFEMLSLFWIGTGVTLTIVSIFGIIGAFKESSIWTNIYGVLIMITFILQTAAAIAAFSLIGKAVSLVSEFINELLLQYYISHDSAERLDLIQKRLGCCGVNGPSDWMNLEHSTAAPKSYIPASCCKFDPYENLNSTCHNYYQNGCAMQMEEVITESIMIIGTTALAISVLQILGIVGAFLFARLIRISRSYRHVQKWDTQSKMVFDSPTYVNYTPLENNYDVKQF